MKALFIMILLGICTGTFVMAQSNFSVTYAIGIPTGDIQSFSSDVSFRGIALDYRYSFQPNLAVGFMLGMNTFYTELPKDTYTLENVSLTGKQYRYSNHLPMLATLTYYLNAEGDIKPFATLGVGTMYSRRNTDMNLYTIELDAWNFVLQPEVGLEFRNFDSVGFVLSAKYLHGFSAGNELPDAQTYLAINIGFCFY